MLTSRVLALIVLFLPTFTAHAQEGQWTTDMPAALKQSQAEQKDLILNFTGSDWCHWCHELEREVFETAEFTKRVPKNFVLVTLDFPADGSKQDPKLAKQNHEWLVKLRVDGFPTVVVCDAQGRPFGLTGYEEGGAKPYLEMLEKFRSARIQRDRLFAAAGKLKGIERARKLDKALGQMDESVVAMFYTPEVDQIISLAVDDVTLSMKYTAIKLVGQRAAALAAIDDLFMTKDADAAMQKLAELDKLFPAKGEQREEFEINRMMLLEHFRRNKEAVSLAKRLIAEHGHDSEVSYSARLVVMDTLLDTNKHDDLLKQVTDWTKTDGFPADEKPELQLYRIQSLRQLKRVEEAVSEAKRLLEHKDIEDFVGDDSVKWLRLFVTEKGEVPSLEDFMIQMVVGSRSARPRSEYWIGLGIGDVPADAREKFNVDSDVGLLATRVLESSPACKAGLKAEDILVSINGEPLKAFDQLIEAINESAGKSPIRFERLRDGEPKVVEVTPAKRPVRENEIELAPIPDYWLKDFAEAAKKADAESKELVVFFSAKWCGPCQVVLRETMPQKEVEAELKKRVVVYVDVDSEVGLSVAEEFEINALPSYLFLNSKKKELGRAIGPVGADEFLDNLRNPTSADGFDRADKNSDGQVEPGEFRAYGSERLGEGMPLRGIFEKLDTDGSGSLSGDEFKDRINIIQKYLAESSVDSYEDPGRDFVPYRGGAEAIDDAKIFGALVHRYADLVKSPEPWPLIDMTSVPETIERPEFASAGKCENAGDLARASLILAGGDDSGEGFFTAGAVLVSSDGLAITNYHVIETAGKTKMMAMDASGKAHRVIEVLAGNKARDVALIRIEGDGFSCVSLAKSAPSAGDDLVMMHHSELRFFTYDRGYVMRYSRISGQTWMEVSAEYAPGGSGCGLFNRNHELVGLVSSITMGDGPDLALAEGFDEEEPMGAKPADDAGGGAGADDEGTDDEGAEGDSMPFGMLVVKHAVPWLAIDSLWKKAK